MSQLYYRLLLLGSLLLGLSLVSCSAPDPHAVEQPTQQQSTQTSTAPLPSEPDPLYLHFSSHGADFYTDVRVEDGVLYYRFFNPPPTACLKATTAQPCWTLDTLETLTQPLSTQTLAALRTQLQQSGILQLDGELFGAQHLKEPALQENLEFQLDGTRRYALYRYRPGVEAKPAAFLTVQTLLLQHAEQLRHSTKAR